jgi:hypothetical protein
MSGFAVAKRSILGARTVFTARGVLNAFSRAIYQLIYGEIDMGNSTRVATALTAAFVVAGLAGCGGGGSTTTATPPVELSKASDCLNRDFYTKNISWQTVDKYSTPASAPSTLTTNFSNETNATFANSATAKLTTTETPLNGTATSSLTYRHLVGNEIVFVGKNTDVDVGYRDGRFALQYGSDSAPGNANSMTTTFVRQKATGETQNWENTVRFFGKVLVGGYQTCRFDVNIRGVSGSYYQTLYIGVTNGLTIKQLAYSTNAMDAVGRFSGPVTGTWELSSASINGVPVTP